MTLSPALADRLSNLESLPSPPHIALRILELARDPDATLPQIAAVVNWDPALASRILRVSNAARYGRGRRCENLRQALVVLGLKATLTVALGFSLVDTLKKGVPNGLDYRKFWQRSLLAALSARALGDYLGRRDGENLFLAALLQDIGMLAIDLLEPDVYRGVDAGASHSDVAARESEVFGADHIAVGAWLLREWNLPDYVTAALGNSHVAGAGQQYNGCDEVSRCVALSGPMADLWLVEERGEAMQTLTALATGMLNINRTGFGELIVRVGERVPETEAIFDISLLEGQRMQDVLDQAMETVLVGDLCALREAGVLIGEALDESGSMRPGTDGTPESLLEQAGRLLRTLP